MAKILVVDDDPGTLVFLEGLLKGEGHQVQTAPDGDAALERAKIMQPDILLTDILMPGLNGNQLAAAVRGLNRLRYVYILVLTSAGEKADKTRALLSGADDFLVKPARPGELLSRLEIGARIQAAENEARAAANRKEELGAVFIALASEVDLVSGHLRNAMAAITNSDADGAMASCQEALAASEQAARMTRIRAAEASGGKPPSTVTPSLPGKPPAPKRPGG